MSEVTARTDTFKSGFQRQAVRSWSSSWTSSQLETTWRARGIINFAKAFLVQKRAHLGKAYYVDTCGAIIRLHIGKSQQQIAWNKNQKNKQETVQSFRSFVLRMNLRLLPTARATNTAPAETKVAAERTDASWTNRFPALDTETMLSLTILMLTT